MRIVGYPHKKVHSRGSMTLYTVAIVDGGRPIKTVYSQLTARLARRAALDLARDNPQASFDPENFLLKSNV